jgi:4-hydroxybenzoate polyprenyltransferase
MLQSLPVRLGIRRSVALVPVLHASALALFALFGVLAGLAIPFFLALAVMAMLVAVVDWQVARDPSRPTRPFRLHIALGAIFLAGVATALYLPSGFL